MIERPLVHHFGRFQNGGIAEREGVEPNRAPLVHECKQRGFFADIHKDKAVHSVLRAERKNGVHRGVRRVSGLLCKQLARRERLIEG